MKVEVGRYWIYEVFCIIEIMKIHKNITEVSTMWMQDNKIKRLKGNHKTNFNVKKHIELNIGDMVFTSKNSMDQNCYRRVVEIISSRQSSMKDYDYIETMCNYVTHKA